MADLDVNAPNRIGDGEGYIEDVDPRFVQPPPTVIPSTLIPSNQKQQVPYDNQALRVPNAHHPHQYLRRDPSSYEGVSMGDGVAGRSPAASDASHYTSVSQRGVNPYWGNHHQQQPQEHSNPYANPYANPNDGGYYDQPAPPMPMHAYGGGPKMMGGPAPRARQQRQQDILLQDNPNFALAGGGRGRGGGGGGGVGRGGRFAGAL